ncbi:hypothetical protein MAR_006587 [Mya arenaria]|uniref:DUF5641 domain-containing protein n=1 Tax=Mya arenaria TaxID=6604 RepID=A0ABY7DC09_MYAAR|nr:hypothetical protein MAR_006587 [Mya arenaria]
MTSQHTVIESSRVCGLKVRGFNSPDYASINQAHSRDFIPVDRSHIPNVDTVKTWPHLAPIADEIPPLQSCDVGLLIGYNCPQALAPRNMLIGKDEELYAVQTLLGWSVIGYVNPSLEAVSMPGVCHRTLVQIKELPPCQPRDVIKVLERDFDQDGDKDKKVSQEDIHFLNLLGSTIHQRDDKHLEMPLPFKERPVMPNNKHLAPQEFGKPLSIELHHFSDASTTGYGQCSYIRFINENAVHCSLVMAKARVAPHKMISIPRLELTAAASGIPDVLECLDRFSSFSKLLSVMARLQRLSNGVKGTHAPTVEERRMAEITNLIKTVRSVLDAFLLQCPGRLDDSSLRNPFYEVSSIVNSRPLAISEIDDPDALEPLKPNHILTAKLEIPQPPPGKFVKENLLLRKRWRRVQFLLEHFWARWKKEYVSQIALRQKWHERCQNVHVGDVVLVKDVDSPRIEWPLARVTEVRIDDDRLVRRVIVKLARKDTTSTSILERSVHKLVLLIEQ